MRNIATIKENDRKALFQNTAAKMGLTNAIIEKDFWVCFMLDYLFHRCEWKDSIAFKGGTSLSKSYGLIERFSEDIDLILDWRVIGFDLNEPWEERSNTKQDIFNKEANRRTEEFLKITFMPAIIADLQNELSTSVNCYIDETDPQTVVFAYNRSFETAQFSRLSVLRLVLLQLGHLPRKDLLHLMQLFSIRKFSLSRQRIFLPFFRNEHFGKRSQFFTVRHSVPKIKLFRQDTRVIIMICTV